jgi:hypothetical protein
MIADPIAAGIGAVSPLAGIAMGLFQRAKARKLEKATVRPVYKTPGEVFLNQKLAQKQASEGINGTTYNTSLNNINRNASAGLETLGKQRNGLAGIGNIVAQTNDATLNLDMQDDAVKKQGLSSLMAQNQNVADYSDKAFQYNEADKYAETMNKISQMRGTGNANINGGINGVTAIAGAAMKTQGIGNTGSTSKSGSLLEMSKKLNFKTPPQ